MPKKIFLRRTLSARYPAPMIAEYPLTVEHKKFNISYFVKLIFLLTLPAIYR